MKKTVFTGSGVAIVTPMHQDGTVNFEELGRVLEFQIENGTDAIITVSYTHLDVYKRQIPKSSPRKNKPPLLM